MGKNLRYGKYAGGTDLMLWLYYFFVVFSLPKFENSEKQQCTCLCSIRGFANRGLGGKVRSDGKFSGGAAGIVPLFADR